MRRRTLLNYAINGAVAVMAAVIAIPSLISAVSPARPRPRPRAGVWRSVGRLGDFPVGSVSAAATADRPSRSPARTVYVWRMSATDAIVFSRACTDLGCAVTYDPGSTFYYCPCHGGIFNHVGEAVAGPPARPLYRYATRVRGELLEIDLASVPLVA